MSEQVCLAIAHLLWQEPIVYISFQLYVCRSQMGSLKLAMMKVFHH